MAEILFKAMIRPSLLASEHRSTWTPDIRASEQLPLAAGSLTLIRRLSLLRQNSYSKFATAASHWPDPAASSRMIHRAAAPKWAVSLCDHLETMIFTSQPNAQNDPGSPSEEEMNPYLFNNFEPVPEMAPTTVQDLHVTGTIPDCMNGEFMRVGPNPRYMPLGGYHWIDGDGMIHGLQLKNGKATYVARYVQTSRLQQEEHYGGPKFLKVGDLKGIKGFSCLVLHFLRKILGVLHNGSEGNANTALVFHNKKLLALQEVDKPYTIKVLEDGDLQTVGIEDFEQKLQHSFSAHPKIDPVTGEMFSIAYGPPALLRAPGLIYHIVSKEGILREPVPITTPYYTMIHDFAITQNYAIFMDLPLGLDLLGMARGGFGIKFDARKESRLGVLPRYATDDSEIRWFTIPTCYIFHTLTAWEEGDEVVLTCCRMTDFDLENLATRSSLSPRLYEYRLNLGTGDVKQRQLSELSVEFPRINTEYTGRKVRYAYCHTGDDPVTGVAKFDFSVEPSSSPNENANSLDLRTERNLAGQFMHGPGCSGGDTVFVPRQLGMNMVDEDDGYLISFVYNENTRKSEAVIIDAKTMGPEPVAVVKLPGRVPNGFHAHFVTEKQLQQQA